MILFKDGVKYRPYSYTSEEELTDMVVEHYKEIFGRNSLYFGPQTLRTRTGEARSDGLVVSLDEGQWYILEVELAKHPLSEHIIPQITKFSIAYDEAETRKKIIGTLYTTIRQTQKIEDLHKILTDLIETQPTIAIVIDQKTPELDIICKKLPFPTQTIEFKTYTRENIGIGVHIHEFQPIFEKEFDAFYDGKEKGFVCNLSKRHYDTIYDAVEIVEHLRDEHDIDPDDQTIDGWTDKDQRLWERASAKSEKPSRRTEVVVRPPEAAEKIPQKLRQVLDVAALVFKGEELTKAFKNVAKQHGVVESSVRDKCTRQLGIDTDKFRKLIQDKNRLKTVLVEKYPDYEDLINRMLG